MTTESKTLRTKPFDGSKDKWKSWEPDIKSLLAGMGALVAIEEDLSKHGRKLTTIERLLKKICTKEAVHDADGKETSAPVYRDATDLEISITDIEDKAKCTLINSITDAGLKRQIALEETAYGMWALLKSIYEGGDLLTDLPGLKKELVECTPDKYSTPDGWFAELRHLNVRLRDVGEKHELDEDGMKSQIFQCLQDSKNWKTFCTAHRPTFMSAEIKLEAVQKLIRDEWKSQGSPSGKGKGGQEGDMAFATWPGKVPNKRCPKCHEYGHRAKNCPEKKDKGGKGSNQKNGSGKDKSHIQCYNCKQYGHYASKCTKDKKGSKSSARADEEEMAFAVRVEAKEVAPEPNCKQVRPESLGMPSWASICSDSSDEESYSSMPELMPRDKGDLSDDDEDDRSFVEYFAAIRRNSASAGQVQQLVQVETTPPTRMDPELVALIMEDSSVKDDVTDLEIPPLIKSRTESAVSDAPWENLEEEDEEPPELETNAYSTSSDGDEDSQGSIMTDVNGEESMSVDSQVEFVFALDDDDMDQFADKYLLDSGSTTHGTSSSVGMRGLTPCHKRITVADGTRCVATMVGDLPLLTKEGCRIVLTNVPVVPGFPRNIISLPKLMEKGCYVKRSHGNTIKVGFETPSGERELVFKKAPGEKLFYLEATRNPDGDRMLAVSLDDEEDEYDSDGPPRPLTKMDINEAHLRLGHPGIAYLRRAAKEFGWKLTGNLEFCVPCEKAKATTKRLAKEATVEATDPGERLMIDTSGPYKESLGKNRYWCLVVDDKTRRKWCYFAAHKNEFTDDLIALFDNLQARGFPVRFVRTDNAPEWEALNDPCEQRLIKRELTAPHTPQQNGRVERAYPVVRNKGYASMMSNTLTRAENMQLWAMCMSDAVDKDNMIPRLGYPNAYAPFDERPPFRPEDMIPFGTQGWKKIRTPMLRHFVPKAEEVYYVGHSKKHASDTALVFKRSTGQVVASRDVRWVYTKDLQVQDRPQLEVPLDDDTENDSDDSSEDGGPPSTEQQSQSRRVQFVRSPILTRQRARQSETRRDDVSAEAVREVVQRLSLDEPSEESDEGESLTEQVVEQAVETGNDATAEVPNVESNASTLSEAVDETTEQVNAVDGPVPVLTAPKSAKEAYNEENKANWMSPTFDEYDKFMNGAWTIEDRPDKKLLRTKNVFTIKMNPITKVDERRVRNVVLGFDMRQGQDFEESFAATPVEQSIRTHIGIAMYKMRMLQKRAKRLGRDPNQGIWKVAQVFDVKAAFLNAPADKELYIEAPILFEEFCASRGIPFERATQAIKLSMTAVHKDPEGQ